MARASDYLVYEEIYRLAREQWLAAQGVTTGVRLSNNTVSEAAPAGTVVGKLMASTSEFALAVVSGPATLNLEDELVLSADAGTAGSKQTVRVSATRASPYMQIIQDLEVEAVAAAPTLATLTLSKADFTEGATAGTVIGAIQNRTAGSTLEVIPNDGRVTVDGSGNLIVGLSAAAVGTFQVTIRETLAGATNSPRSTTFTITVNEVQAATAQILEFEVLGPTNITPDINGRGINADGWAARVRVPDNGLDVDPTKIIVYTDDPGFAVVGGVVTAVRRQRTLRGATHLRSQVLPSTSGTAPIHKVAGSGVVDHYITFLEPIWEATEIDDVVAEPGFCGILADGSVASANIAQNSTLPYEKAVCTWLNFPHERATGTHFNVELWAMHESAMLGQGVAGVEFIGHDGVNTTGTVTCGTPELSSLITQGSIPEVYKAAVPLAPLNQASATGVCEVNARIYPHIGDGSAVLDLKIDGVVWPTASPQTPLRFVNDKNGTYGGAIAVVGPDGNDATAVVSLDAAVARANKFLNLHVAMAALRTFNNTASPGHSVLHDDVGGASVYLRQGTGADQTYQLTSTVNTIPGGTAWFQIQNDPANTTHKGVFLSPTSAATRVMPERTMIACNVIKETTNAVFERSDTAVGGSTMMAVRDATVTLTGGTITPWIRRTGLVYQRNVTYPTAGGPNLAALRGEVGTSGLRCAMSHGIIFNGASSQYIASYSTLACRGRLLPYEADASWQTSPDGGVCANSEFYAMNSTTVAGLGSAWPISRGYALVQNIYENNSTSVTLAICDDTVNCKNVICAYLLAPGPSSSANGEANINHFYNDQAHTVGTRKWGVWKFIASWRQANKADFFSYNNEGGVTGNVGAMDVQYGVRSEGNVLAFNRPITPDGSEYYRRAKDARTATGVGVIPFINNQAGSGKSGFGDYRPDGGVDNPLYARVGPGRGMLRYDLDGVLRNQEGNGAAGPYEIVDDLALQSWPYSFEITDDVVGLGSSTMVGGETGARSPSSLKHIETDTVGATYIPPATDVPLTGGVILANRGAGGTTSTDMENSFVGENARTKAAHAIIQPGGNYRNAGTGTGTEAEPVPGILQDMADIDAMRSGAPALFAPKHNDNASGAASGGVDHYRLREINRRLSLWKPGRVTDASLFFRNWNTGNPADAPYQAVGMVPPSLAADGAHLNGAGNQLLARYVYEPWIEAMEGGLPFVPHQRITSTEATNQTNGGLVGVVQHDNTILNTLSGVSVRVVGTDLYTVAIENGVITLRNKGGFDATGQHTFRIRVVKNGRYRDSWVQVFRAMLTGTGAHRTAMGGNILVHEGPINGVRDTQRFSFALGLKMLPGWDAASGVARQIIGSSSTGKGGLNFRTLQTSNQNVRAQFHGPDGTMVLSVSGPSAQGFTEAAGIRWMFISADMTDGTYMVATDANAAVTTGATTGPVVGSTIRVAPLGDLTNPAWTWMFANSVNATAPYGLNGLMENYELICMAMWADTKIDWSATSGGARDLVRDPATKASLLNTTRGANAPGFVGGTKAFLHLEGPAGNIQAGLNLSNPTEQFVASDRVPMTTVNF